MMMKLYSNLLMITLGFYVIILHGNKHAVEGIIGLNWGRTSSQRLVPSMVVDLLLQNGINEAKIFNPAVNVLGAFSGTDIRVSITISNFFFYEFNSTQSTSTWINKWITAYKEKIRMRYLIVGNEPFSASFKNKTYNNAVEVLKVVQNGLREQGLGERIKTTIPHYTDVLNVNKNSKPSEVEFRDDIKDKMVEYVKILKANNAPALLNMFLFHYVLSNGIDIEFAFMDNKSGYVVEDSNGLIYTNAFEFLYDSFLWAMKKAGGEDVKLVVAQVGWPTDGYTGANKENAHRFYKTFLPYIKSKKGTPLRPGVEIDVYLFSLSDENRYNSSLGGFQRHWGIYEFNGEPKYKIDFSGQGRDMFPSTAKGVIHMPKRWCIFNGVLDDMEKVNHEYDNCCIKADCSSLGDGGSCSHLDYKSRVSYAFNRYFQTMSANLSEKACRMNGLGKVVVQDPSDDTCVFPIEIISAERLDKKEELFGAREEIDSTNSQKSNTAAPPPRPHALHTLPNMALLLVIFIVLPPMIGLSSK